MRNFEKLQKKLGVKFRDLDLLRQSVVHRSYLNENSGFDLDHNERLEFLGDAVLELVVTEHLYNNYPNPEGDLTNWRSSLVNSEMLASRAHEVGLNDHLYLSKGESKDKGKAREIILANAFEALIGAVYLDQGYTVAQQFVMKFIVVELPKILENDLYLDPKSKFQEAVQEKLALTPVYKVLEEWGPDHDKHFKVGVFLENRQVGEGSGSSKQQAQETAAGQALESGTWEK